MLSVRLNSLNPPKIIFTPPVIPAKSPDVIAAEELDLGIRKRLAGTGERRKPFKTQEEYDRWWRQVPGDTGSLYVWTRLPHWNERANPTISMIVGWQRELSKISYDIHGEPEWAQIVTLFNTGLDGPNTTYLPRWTSMHQCETAVWRLLRKEELREVQNNDIVSANLRQAAAHFSCEPDFVGTWSD